MANEAGIAQVFNLYPNLGVTNCSLWILYLYDQLTSKFLGI